MQLSPVPALGDKTPEAHRPTGGWVVPSQKPPNTAALLVSAERDYR